MLIIQQKALLFPGVLKVMACTLRMAVVNQMYMTGCRILFVCRQMNLNFSGQKIKECLANLV